jgi:hypothetical protein
MEGRAAVGFRRQRSPLVTGIRRAQNEDGLASGRVSRPDPWPPFHVPPGRWRSHRPTSRRSAPNSTRSGRDRSSPLPSPTLHVVAPRRARLDRERGAAGGPMLRGRVCCPRNISHGSAPLRAVATIVAMEPVWTLKPSRRSRVTPEVGWPAADGHPVQADVSDGFRAHSGTGHGWDAARSRFVRTAGPRPEGRTPAYVATSVQSAPVRGFLDLEDVAAGGTFCWIQ